LKGILFKRHTLFRESGHDQFQISVSISKKIGRIFVLTHLQRRAAAMAAEGGDGGSSSDNGRGHTGESGDTSAGSGCNHTDAGGVSGTDAAAGERLGRRASGAAAMSVLRRGGTGGRGAGDGGSGADTGGNGGSAGIYTL
jgi:hypothetical protein